MIWFSRAPRMSLQTDFIVYGMPGLIAGAVSFRVGATG